MLTDALGLQTLRQNSKVTPDRVPDRVSVLRKPGTPGSGEASEENVDLDPEARREKLQSHAPGKSRWLDKVTGAELPSAVSNSKGHRNAGQALQRSPDKAPDHYIGRGKLQARRVVSIHKISQQDATPAASCQPSPCLFLQAQRSFECQLLSPALDSQEEEADAGIPSIQGKLGACTTVCDSTSRGTTARPNGISHAPGSTSMQPATGAAQYPAIDLSSPEPRFTALPEQFAVPFFSYLLKPHGSVEQQSPMGISSHLRAEPKATTSVKGAAASLDRQSSLLAQTRPAQNSNGDHICTEAAVHQSTAQIEDPTLTVEGYPVINVSDPVALTQPHNRIPNAVAGNGLKISSGATKAPLEGEERCTAPCEDSGGKGAAQSADFRAGPQNKQRLIRLAASRRPREKRTGDLLRAYQQ